MAKLKYVKHVDMGMMGVPAKVASGNAGWARNRIQSSHMLIKTSLDTKNFRNCSIVPFAFENGSSHIHGRQIRGQLAIQLPKTGSFHLGCSGTKASSKYVHDMSMTCPWYLPIIISTVKFHSSERLNFQHSTSFFWINPGWRDMSHWSCHGQYGSIWGPWSSIMEKIGIETSWGCKSLFPYATHGAGIWIPPFAPKIIRLRS